MFADLLTHIRALFARDKDAFWFNEATDYERSLSKMTLSELASELQRTQVRYETANTIIVEHTLAARLARIQSRASWWSGWLGFAGAMLAAALTFYLGQLSVNIAPKVECTPGSKPEKLPVERPVQSMAPTLKTNTLAPEAVQHLERVQASKQSNALSKP